MKTVTIIDDDAGVLSAMRMVLEGAGYGVSAFEAADAFLDAPMEPGCIVSDVLMPRMSGLELLKTLKQRRDPRPLILITAHGDIDMAVQAMREGAFDFIEKPFDETRLIAVVRRGIDAATAAIAEHDARAELRRRYDELSARQKEVMKLVLHGCSNKEIANRLGISVRTVESYRAWVMERMHAGSIIDLVRIGVSLGIDQAAVPDEAAGAR